jgi:hypothetical protein
VLDVSPAGENTGHEISQPEAQFERQENAQASVPGSDEESGSMGIFG